MTGGGGGVAIKKAFKKSLHTILITYTVEEFDKNIESNLSLSP